MLSLFYRHAEDLLDARTALLIARSINSEPSRWTLSGEQLERDDEILVYLPERENDRYSAPGFRLFDVFGESIDIDPPRLAGLALRLAVDGWLRRNRGTLAGSVIVNTPANDSDHAQISA